VVIKIFKFTLLVSKAQCVYPSQLGKGLEQRCKILQLNGGLNFVTVVPNIFSRFPYKQICVSVHMQ
jgi:hypothetical protein